MMTKLSEVLSHFQNEQETGQPIEKNAHIMGEPHLLEMYLAILQFKSVK